MDDRYVVFYFVAGLAQHEDFVSAEKLWRSDPKQKHSLAVRCVKSPDGDTEKAITLVLEIELFEELLNGILRSTGVVAMDGRRYRYELVSGYETHHYNFLKLSPIMERQGSLPTR